MHWFEPVLIFEYFNSVDLIANCVEKNYRLLREAYQFNITMQCEFKDGWLFSTTTTPSEREIDFAAMRELSRWNTHMVNEELPSGSYGTLQYRFNNERRLLTNDDNNIRIGNVCMFGDSQMRHLFNELLRHRGHQCLSNGRLIQGMNVLGVSK